MRRAFLLLALVACALTSCNSDDVPTAAAVPSGPSLTISDAVHSSGNAHFFFLPPLVSAPEYSGISDGTLSPTVKVCEWDGAVCGVMVAQFSMDAGTASEAIRYDATAEQYIVNWHTDQCIDGPCTLDPAKTYRLSVLVRAVELGFADVDVVPNGSQLRNVQTAEYIGLVNGRTLPVKFRIEAGALPAVIVANPGAVSIRVVQTGTTSAELLIENGGVSPLTDISVGGFADQLTGDPAPWVTATVAPANAPATVTITASPGPDIPQGTYQLRFDIASPVAANSPYNYTGVSVTVEAAPFRGYAAIDAGDEHTCALDTEGKPYCWGANHVRQLGIGTTDNSAHPTPVLVSGDLRLMMLSTAGGTTCGLDADSRAWCWGWGSDGQLGDGIAQGSSVPIAVAGGRQYATLSTGHLSTCAITLAGAMYCWGHLFDIAPWPIPGGHVFHAVSVGSDFACGITPVGAAYCFGVNDQGQFGTTAPAPSYTLTPVPVEGDHTFTSVASGKAHSCALTSDGEAWCWGRGSEGQLGDGSFMSHTAPAIIPGFRFRSLTAAGWSTCGITVDNVAMCWGANDRGQVGDGTTVYHAVPTAINGEPMNYISLQAGRDGGCALTDQGEGHCWGFNTYGRLGNGTTSMSTIPVTVLNP